RMLKRKDKNGRPKFIDPEEEERKRQHKAMNRACYERTMEKEKLRAASDELRASPVTEQAWEQDGKAVPALLRRAKDPGIGLRGYTPRIATRIVRLLRWGRRPHNTLTRRRRASEKAYEFCDTS
ncbi:MAG: hypothetical protein J7621_25125, partial [Niastella sp.]|nr:hypothetical protein [Niastella sp.]